MFHVIYAAVLPYWIRKSIVHYWQTSLNYRFIWSEKYHLWPAFKSSISIADTNCKGCYAAFAWNCHSVNKYKKNYAALCQPLWFKTYMTFCKFSATVNCVKMCAFVQSENKLYDKCSRTSKFNFTTRRHIALHIFASKYQGRTDKLLTTG